VSFVLCFFLLSFRCHLTLLFHDHPKASFNSVYEMDGFSTIDGHGDGVGVRVRWEHGWRSVSFSGFPMASDHFLFA